MRIIAGIHRSRTIKTLEGTNTRPTANKVKEAVFNSIGPYFYDDKIMLDLFSGSGSVGLEAISRGMGKVIFNDFNLQAYKLIKDNIETLKCVDQSIIFNMDYMNVLNKVNNDNYQFDYIFLDPPYHLNAIDIILKFIDDNNLLKENGVIVCESLKKDEFNYDYQNIIKFKDKNYGITKITYFKTRSDKHE